MQVLHRSQEDDKFYAIKVCRMGQFSILLRDIIIVSFLLQWMAFDLSSQHRTTNVLLGTE